MNGKEINTLLRSMLAPSVRPSDYDYVQMVARSIKAGNEMTEQQKEYIKQLKARLFLIHSNKKR